MDLRAQFSMFYWKRLLATVLETILMIFWQRICLFYAFGLEICLRLNWRALLRDILKQSSIDPVSWLLVTTHMWIHNKKKTWHKNIKYTVRRENDHQETGN